MRKDLTIQEHVQAIREGRDYKSPLLAINPTIEGLVHCGLIVRDHEVNLTPETRALDAIGVQVERELGNRAQMIEALVDRLNTVEALLREARAKGFNDTLEICDRVESTVAKLERTLQVVQNNEANAMPQLGGHTV